MSLDESAAPPAQAMRAPRFEPGVRSDLPELAPLPMRAQDLRHWDGRAAAIETSPRGVGARRAALFFLSAALAAIAGAATLQVFRHDGLAAFEVVSLALFAPLAFGLAFWFSNAAIGLALLARGVDDPLGLTAAPDAPARTRCALLAPIYNEDCAAVFARFSAMTRSLDRENAGAAFDLFILSDTNTPAVAAAERRAFEALRTQTRVNVYYRRRLQNTDNKAGNVADWVRRFGGAYETMIVLDADSLMHADVMRRLVSAMERHPGVGLIQTMPTIVQARTLLGRYLQFGAALFSPAAWSGLAWWTGAEGSYWGHNAIVRVRAFAAHAGLPHLDGPRPFGGSILSHDVVEAALIRRGGWAVHMAPPLAGSFEEAPPTLAEFVKRDRRWCQGNLQHVSLIGAPGLHWVSRFQLTVGVAGYLVSPIFVLFLLIGVGAAAAAAIASGHGPRLVELGPDWDDAVRAGALVAVMIFGPKLFGCARVLCDPALRRSFGGARAVLAGVAAEMTLSVLLTPLLVATQTKAVLEILSGRDAGWRAQQRSASGERSEEEAPFEWLTIAGFLTAWLAQSTGAFLAMAPILAGLIAAGPLSRALAREDMGEALRAQGVLLTPEERAPPAILRGMARAAARPASQAAEGPLPHVA